MAKQVDHRSRLPKHVVVGAVDFAVIPDDSAEFAKLRCLGTTDVNAAEIRLLRHPENSRQLANTFVHEVLHAIVAEYMFGELDGDAEEKVVRNLANGLCQVLVANPGLMKTIQGLLRAK